MIDSYIEAKININENVVFSNQTGWISHSMSITHVNYDNERIDFAIILKSIPVESCVQHTTYMNWERTAKKEWKKWHA